MSRKLSLTLILLTIFSLLAIAPVFAQDEFVFGVILVGPDEDRGWSQAHYEGGLYVEENIPGTRMIVFENLNPGTPEATLESVTRDMVDQGARLIITTSDAFEFDTDAVAALFPDVVFINATGSNALGQTGHDVFPDLVAAPEGEALAVPSNVGNVMLQIEWSKLMAGCAAALTTETGSIGYLGPLINPETRRLAASAYLGARYCYEHYAGGDPAELVFNVTWIGFWFHNPDMGTLDPSVEVGNFFDNGADVVLSGIDSQDAVIVAGQRAEQGERVFSVAYDFIGGCDQAPTSCLGVPYFNWGPSYAAIVQSVIDGTWEQSWDWIAPNWEDAAASGVGFLPGEGLSEDAAASLTAFYGEMSEFAADEANAGQFFLWQGPLNLQDGTELAAEGEFVDPLEIWYLPQLLEGMGGASS
jgi:simple sugar transport system substrate-binding protein